MSQLAESHCAAVCQAQHMACGELPACMAHQAMGAGGLDSHFRLCRRLKGSPRSWLHPGTRGVGDGRHTAAVPRRRGQAGTGSAALPSRGQARLTGCIAERSQLPGPHVLPLAADVAAARVGILLKVITSFEQPANKQTWSQGRGGSGGLPRGQHAPAEAQQAVQAASSLSHEGSSESLRAELTTAAR